jgi:hypothetical protein
MSNVRAIPTLVKTRVNMNVLRLHQSIEAIRTGRAMQRDWAVLYQSAHFLAFCAAYAPAHSRKQAENAAELGYIACAALKDRFEAKGKIGANGDELEALKAFAEGFEDFFKRASARVEERGHNDLTRWLQRRQQTLGVAA